MGKDQPHGRDANGQAFADPEPFSVSAQGQELTFLAAGIASAVYTLGIKKQKLIFRQEAPKYTGAIFETIGQFFYIYALADEAHVALSAPIISAYCAASVLWGRIFLKEKLSWKHYVMIALVVIGIVMIGVFDI